MLERAFALRGAGQYVVQAAIASLHADEPRDWPQIAALYAELSRLTGSAVVELSRAVAIAEAEGPQAGLRIVDALDLGEYHYAARHPRVNCFAASAAPSRPAQRTRRALALVRDDAERRLLERQLAAVQT